jgi:hypothetical protein
LLDNGTVIQSHPLDGNGCEQFDLDWLNAGAHAITANYSGNGSIPPGDSAPIAITIARASVDLKLDCDPGMIQFGQDEHCHLTLRAPGIGPGATNTQLSGAVTVTMDGVPLPVELNPGGNAMITISQPAIGNHSAVASFAGQQNYNPATASQAFTVRAPAGH